MADRLVEALLGVMAKAGLVDLVPWGAGVNTPTPRWDGVAGWDVDPKRDRCHFSSPLGDSVGDEKEVEDEEDVRLDVSSAPEDVTS